MSYVALETMWCQGWNQGLLQAENYNLELATYFPGPKLLNNLSNLGINSVSLVFSKI